MDRTKAWVAGEEDDPGRILRWAASLRKTAAATLAEAQSRGPVWEFYELSMSSAGDQDAQAYDLEQIAEALGLTDVDAPKAA